MGLDVYVGSLTRYYAGDWETVIQQYAREQGISYQVVGNAPPDDAVTDRNEIRDAVEGWRALVSSVLDRELAWNEEAESPYFTDKPAWDGYGSLQLLAACDERGKSTPKKAVTEWDRERTWRKAAGDSQSRYRHLYSSELWLPGDFDPPVESNDVAGNGTMIGSSERLLAELSELNSRTYKGSGDDLARWRHEGAAPDSPFDDAARFGLSVFLELAERSVSERLPMKLDY